MIDRQRILELIASEERRVTEPEAVGALMNLRNAINAMEEDMPQLTFQITPETIGAVEDALKLHLGNLLNRIEETPRELAAILLQQAVCASVQPAGENNG